MAKQDDFFDEFEPHSKLKQDILQFYLESWAHKLILSRARHQKLLMVDAFAGPGADAKGNRGSPLRMATIAKEFEGRLTLLAGRDISIRVTTIEKNRGHYNDLVARMAPYGDQVRVLRGSLDQHIESILTDAGSAPMLVFLDPYGVKGLEGETIRRALRGPQREVFMLVDDDGAHRLAQVATIGEPRCASRRKRRLTLFDDPDVVALEEAARLARAREQLRRTGVLAAEHLTRAMSSEDWRAIADLPLEEAREAIVTIFEGFLHASGASYTTRIPIRDVRGHLKYVLLHASSMPEGRSTMKEAVHRALNSCELPDEVVQLMWDDMRTPEDLLSRVRQRFGGVEVPWTERRAPCVKDFLLQETGAFPWQLEEVKAAMSKAGFRLPGPKIRYAFPIVAGIVGTPSSQALAAP